MEETTDKTQLENIMANALRQAITLNQEAGIAYEWLKVYDYAKDILENMEVK